MKHLRMYIIISFWQLSIQVPLLRYRFYQLNIQSRLEWISTYFAFFWRF